MRKWDINRVLSFIRPKPNPTENNADKLLFPQADTIKIGHVIYRITAHYGEKYGSLKPKIERLLRRDMEIIKKDHNLKLTAESNSSLNYSNASGDVLYYNHPVNIAYPATGKEL